MGFLKRLLGGSPGAARSDTQLPKDSEGDGPDAYVGVGPSEMPPSTRPPAVAAEPRRYANTTCPYCGAPPARLPKAKTMCRTCGNPIHVILGLDGLTHLLKEADATAMMDAKMDYYMNRRR